MTTEGYKDTDAVRADMRRLLAVVREIRKISPRMEMSQLAVLLEVIIDPGVWASDLQSRIGTSTGALSRNVSALSQVSYARPNETEAREGLGLITKVQDPTDGRASRLAPTRKGRTLAERLSDILRR